MVDYYTTRRNPPKTKDEQYEQLLILSIMFSNTIW